MRTNRKLAIFPRCCSTRCVLCLVFIQRMGRKRVMTWLCVLWWWSSCEQHTDREWRWEWYGGYEQKWEIRGMIYLIGFWRPRVRVIIHWIGSCTCAIGNCKLTHTQISLNSQFLIIISHLLSSLTLLASALRSPKNPKLYRPSLSLHAMMLFSHQVQNLSQIAYLPLPASLLFLKCSGWFQSSTIPRWHVVHQDSLGSLVTTLLMNYLRMNHLQSNFI